MRVIGIIESRSGLEDSTASQVFYSSVTVALGILEGSRYIVLSER
jgi:hypothetical protein